METPQEVVTELRGTATLEEDHGENLESRMEQVSRQKLAIVILGILTTASFPLLYPR